MYASSIIWHLNYRYTQGIDMWSLGCILAEMFLGKPLFQGTSTINQIDLIMATIPPPTPEGNAVTSKVVFIYSTSCERCLVLCHPLTSITFSVCAHTLIINVGNFGCNKVLLCTDFSGSWCYGHCTYQIWERTGKKVKVNVTLEQAM